jgi:hypothetical protein
VQLPSLTRSALPLFLLALGAVSGCNCNGKISTAGDGGSTDGGDGGSGNGDGGVDICQIIYCPPDGGFDGGPIVIDFGNTDGGQSFNLDGGSAGSYGNGVYVDPNGHVTLSSADFQLNFAVIANWTMGTVSKYDTKNLLPDGGIHELARYISVVPVDGLGQSLLDAGISSRSVFNPSRTAIDINSDIWVANFAWHNGTVSQYFSVTKIAGNPYDCIDRNGNGKIDTSFDDPNTPGGTYGVIDPTEYANPPNPSDILGYDECVLFTQPLGNINPTGASIGEGAIAIARGIEGAAGDVWVGTWSDRKIFRLDPTNGVPKAVLPDGGIYLSVPDIKPYGAAVDALNRLWVVDQVTNRLALVNANDPVQLLAGNTGAGLPRLGPPNTFPTGGYGIAVDGLNRVWIPNWNTGPTATLYTPDPTTPTTGTWTKFDFSTFISPTGTKLTQPRGVATDVDGKVWMTSDSKTGTSSGSAAMVFGIYGTTDGGVTAGTPYVFNTAAGPTNLVDATDVWSKTSIGVGLDQDGNLWVNNSSGNVMRVDRTTGAVTKSANQAGALYTYSDFTGYQLRHITTKQGSYFQTVAGCSRSAEWDLVTWSASNVNPGHSGVALYVRGSNNFDFTLSQRYGPWSTSPADLQAPPTGPVPQFKYLQLEFVLFTDDPNNTQPPTLNSFSITTSCVTPIN